MLSFNSVILRDFKLNTLKFTQDLVNVRQNYFRILKVENITKGAHLTDKFSYNKFLLLERTYDYVDSVP